MSKTNGWCCIVNKKFIPVFFPNYCKMQKTSTRAYFWSNSIFAKFFGGGYFGRGEWAYIYTWAKICIIFKKASELQGNVNFVYLPKKTSPK